MHILLMRHGDAVDQMVDQARPLSEVGIRQVERVCEYLDSQPLEIQTIYHSQKTRALQTAGIVASYFNMIEKLKYSSTLDPDMDADKFIDELVYFQENTLFVGHLPTIQIILHQLLESSSEAIPPIYFEPATVVILEKRNNERWRLAGFFNPDKPEI